MKISFEHALGPHPQALSLRAARTTVLANNLANADTPGFKARDVDFKAALAAAEQAQDGPARLTNTHTRHLQPAAASIDHGLKFRAPTMPSLDGNTVDAHVEQTQFAENNMQFLASLRFVDSRFKSMLAALKGE